MKKLKAAFILIRPTKCLITALSIWIAAIIAGKVYMSWRVLTAMVSAFAIAGFGNVVSDLFDIETDRPNKSFIPNGSLIRFDMIVIAIILAVAGVALSLVVSDNARIIAISAIILLLIYAPISKRLSVAGNIIIALISSLVFIYGGMAVDRMWGAVILSIYSFFLYLGREIVKDIQDNDADSSRGRYTEAVYDSHLAREIASAIFLVLIFITVVPFVFGIYKYGYMIAVLAIDIILAISIYCLLKTENEHVMRRIAVWLKIAMPVGLLAVYLGSRGW